MKTIQRTMKFQVYFLLLVFITRIAGRIFLVETVDKPISWNNAVEHGRDYTEVSGEKGKMEDVKKLDVKKNKNTLKSDDKNDTSLKYQTARKAFDYIQTTRKAFDYYNIDLHLDE